MGEKLAEYRSLGAGDIVARLRDRMDEIAELETVGEAKAARDQAAAVQAYSRQQKGWAEVALVAAERKIRAERRIGQLLTEMEKQGPGEYQRFQAGTVAPSLADLGFAKATAHRFQMEALLPEEDFEEFIEQGRRRGELTSAAAYKLGREYKAKQTTKEGDVRAPHDDPDAASTVVSDLNTLVRAGEKFGCIYADPPWRYDNQATRGATRFHYGTMSLDEIIALPVGELAADTCHLHLWTTNAYLFECPKIFEA
jgi:hypothetical protein